MQNYAVSASVLVPQIAKASERVSMIDLGAPARPGPKIGGALMAPAAMLVGAVGLLGLWAAAPRSIAAAPPASASAPRIQVAAVTSAANGQSRALDRMLIDLGAPVDLAAPAPSAITATPGETLADLRGAEARMVSAADLEAQTRLASAGAAFRSTGLDARPYMTAAPAPSAVSPLELKDAHVLAARLDLDPALARQVQHTARDLIAARALGDAETSLPLAIPVDDPVRSSPFGVRTDPFTGSAAFHPGQDFAGHYGEAIHVTAPGVVSFVGQRSGYGNCVEVDHGHGFKTRYGHLEAFASSVGQAVKTGDVIGRMGSTGRSTGVHLHYEVWASGRLQNPARFLQDPLPVRGG